jgi:hypothetical protein
MDFFEESYLSFFEYLNKHGVRFILVGGFAVNHHGFNRVTADLDVWLDESTENRQKLVNALKEKEVVGCEVFLTYPLIAGFAEILLENGIYLDFMADLQFFKQNDFGACYNVAVDHKLTENIVVKVLHLNHLISEKEKSNREKDKEDAHVLKRLYRLD